MRKKQGAKRAGRQEPLLGAVWLVWAGRVGELGRLGTVCAQVAVGGGVGGVVWWCRCRRCGAEPVWAVQPGRREWRAWRSGIGGCVGTLRGGVLEARRAMS